MWRSKDLSITQHVMKPGFLVIGEKMHHLIQSFAFAVSIGLVAVDFV